MQSHRSTFRSSSRCARRNVDSQTSIGSPDTVSTHATEACGVPVLSTPTAGGAQRDLSLSSPMCQGLNCSGLKSAEGAKRDPKTSALLRQGLRSSSRRVRRNVDFMVIFLLLEGVAASYVLCAATTCAETQRQIFVGDEAVKGIQKEAVFSERNTSFATRIQGDVERRIIMFFHKNATCDLDAINFCQHTFEVTLSREDQRVWFAKAPKPQRGNVEDQDEPDEDLTDYEHGPERLMEIILFISPFLKELEDAPITSSSFTKCRDNLKAVRAFVDGQGHTFMSASDIVEKLSFVAKARLPAKAEAIIAELET